MSNAIVQADVQKSIQERISDKIKQATLDFIPPEVFDQLSKACLDEFLNGSPNNRRDRNYNPMYDKDTLPGMIRLEFLAIAKVKLKEFFDRPEMQSMWTNTGEQASQAVKDMIRDNADVFVAEMFSQVLGVFMSQMRNNMMNRTY